MLYAGGGPELTQAERLVDVGDVEELEEHEGDYLDDWETQYGDPDRAYDEYRERDLDE